MVKTIFYDLVYALYFENQTYSGKITITFEPLVRFWKFKALNWSKFNFLLICGNSSLILSITQKMPGKNECNITHNFKETFFLQNDHMLNDSAMLLFESQIPVWTHKFTSWCCSAPQKPYLALAELELFRQFVYHLAVNLIQTNISYSMKIS